MTAVLRHILAVTELPPAELCRLWSAAGPDVQETIMSTAERIAEAARKEGYEKGAIQGHAEGKAEGKTEGQRDLLRRQLHARFGPLPASAAARIGRAGPEELGHWAERILMAWTLDDVLGR